MSSATRAWIGDDSSKVGGMLTGCSSGPFIGSDDWTLTRSRPRLSREPRLFARGVGAFGVLIGFRGPPPAQRRASACGAGARSTTEIRGKQDAPHPLRGGTGRLQ